MQLSYLNPKLIATRKKTNYISNIYMRHVQCKGPWWPIIFQGSIEESKNLILLLQKQRRMSAFIKFFGNELTFLEVRQENVDQLAQDLSDLLFGLKTKLEYPEQGSKFT